MTPLAADDRHYPAALYELVHRGTPGDLAFYRACCEGSDEVVELGCGYGRVLEALAHAQGIRLLGIERDGEMLARARRRLPGSVRLVRADMAALPLRGPCFDRILIPHSGLYCLDPAARAACLDACARVLAPEGRLVLDAWGADAFHADSDPAAWDADRLEPVVRVEEAGTVYDVFERSEWFPDDQRIEVAYEYIPRGGGEAAVGRLVHHYLLQEQLPPLLAAAGLVLESFASDWAGTPAGPRADTWIATIRRADA